jgi:deoxyribonuclease IV
MPLLGAHMSIAGGFHLAFDRIAQVRGEAMQFFVKNQRQWQAPAPGPEAVELFRQRWEKAGRIPIAAHDTYLINLATSDPVVAGKSIAALADELSRTQALGIPYLIMHPGAHVGQGVEQGLLRFVSNLDQAIELSQVGDVSVLIETTAGQGTQLGSSFEEIGFILTRSLYRERLGVCFDTCHAFAAGYDIRNRESYDETFSRFDEIIGLDRLKFFHLNDSKRDLGSSVDRHEHIGKGKIGLPAFELLLNDPRFRHHPMVLETPKGKDPSNDIENLRVLRSLVKLQTKASSSPELKRPTSAPE